ncbi:collagen alpha-2(I) chain-like [Planococcus citri]|uniref:collagen alpha-2(I) chain-like n=1 Tax=Planococcus citri TaxID=170843 RepID=UPI0031F9BF7C
MYLFLTFIIITIFHGASRSVNPSKIHRPKTCREVFDGGFGNEDRSYWINPSQGDEKYMILADCKLKTRETCISSYPYRSKKFDISGAKSEVWLGKRHPSYQIDYRADANQLRMLQQMSKYATQSITYHCKNVIVYYDSINKNFERSVKLRGWNNDEITPQNLSNLQFMSGYDNCQHINHPHSSETRITYSTNVPSQLPITDIAVRDIGRPRQYIYVDIEPVCFH